MQVSQILKENNERQRIKNAPFNPITGENSPLDRVLFELKDFYLPKQYIPLAMAEVPLVKKTYASREYHSIG